MNPQYNQKNVEILLLACYELGHQPLSLAWPVAMLEEAGFSVAPIDLAVEEFPKEIVLHAKLVAIATPMHTAIRIGVSAAQRVRELNPRAHICFYGLYAHLNTDYLFQKFWIDQNFLPLADSIISGEYEVPLVQLAQALQKDEELTQIAGISTPRFPAQPYLERIQFSVPNRQFLRSLKNYSHYINGGDPVRAGYAETSRGCLHTCKHCPIVPVYEGRFFVVPAEVVLADIRQQVAQGAGHISYGDPDFLNGPGHVLKIVRAVNNEFPELTFDFTTRVEHLIKNHSLLPELRSLGASFVISAFESTSNLVLAQLDKGHTVEDMDKALQILKDNELPVRPTWVPFTPWTTLEDYLHMLEWILNHHLIPNIPMVQYSIRLLIPPKSKLLPGIWNSDWLGSLQAENFTYAWTHPDSRMDELYDRLAMLAHRDDYEPEEAFTMVAREAYDIAKRPLVDFHLGDISNQQAPRLSEHWFC